MRRTTIPPCTWVPVDIWIAAHELADRPVSDGVTDTPAEYTPLASRPAPLPLPRPRRTSGRAW